MCFRCLRKQPWKTWSTQSSSLQDKMWCLCIARLFATSCRVPVTLVTSPESELVSSESEASPTSQQVSRRAESANRSKIAKERICKVPRPPNAFTLYRQHHHLMVKQNNPGVKNNQICKSTVFFWCSSYLFANPSQLCSSDSNGRTKIQR